MPCYLKFYFCFYAGVFLTLLCATFYKVMAQVGFFSNFKQASIIDLLRVTPTFSASSITRGNKAAVAGVA